jgi:methionyl-tRNA formyltransferase
MMNGARVKILQCELHDAHGAAGRFIDDSLTIACADTSIRCLELQREGKGAMAADVFLRGFPITAGMDTA